MGMPGPFAGSHGRYDSCCDCPPQPRQQPQLPNPDPANFVIEKIEQAGRFVIVLARYPDCTNFEGRKVMVYEDQTVERIRRRKRLDPHFADSSDAPAARFRPTDEGWKRAVAFCRSQR